MKRRFTAFLVLIMSVITLQLSAQGLGEYVFSTGTDASKWIALTNPTSITTIYGDDTPFPLCDIGFSFVFGGESYTQFSTNTNGNFRLGTPMTTGSYYSTPFGATNANYNNPKIVGVGRDMGTGTNGYIKYELTGYAPNRVLVCEFATGYTYSSSNVADVKWQVQLFEGSNNICIVYGDAAPANVPENIQIGLCMDASDVITINPSTHTVAYGATSTTYSTWPGANRYYEFAAPNISCMRVTNLHATNVNAGSADIVWVADPSQYSWDIYVTENATDTVDENTIPTYTSFDTIYTIVGLTSTTNYYVYVRANCGDGVSSWRSTSFSTTQVLATLPYTQDFESAEENGNWQYSNGSHPNQWVIGSAANNTSGGANALYISNDNGSTSGYNVSSYSYVWAYRDIDFGTSTEYQLDFDWKSGGEGNSSNQYDYFQVYLGDAVIPSGATVPQGLTELTGKLYLQDAWQHQSVTINGSHHGARRLYFFWKNDSSSGTQPGAIVDNISITGLACGAPISAVLDSTTATSIAFHINPASEYDALWQYVVVGFNDTLDESMATYVTSTNCEITGLESSQAYTVYVRTDCGSDYSNWVSFTAMTECSDYMIIPFEEDFDIYGSGTNSYFPQCWSRLTNYSPPYPYIHSNSPYSGTGALYFFSSYYYGNYSIAITPQIDTVTNPVNTLTLDFMLKRTSSGTGYGALQVGLMTNPADTSTFTLVHEILSSDLANANTWYEFEIPFTNYTGVGSYIALRKSSDLTGSTYLDNFRVYTTSSCVRPTGITCSNTTHQSADIDWTVNGEENAWMLVVVPHGDDMESGTIEYVVQHPYTVGNLNSDTQYDVYVKADCGGTESEWTSAYVFTTACAPEVAPYSEDFSGYNTQMSHCWSRYSGLASGVFAGTAALQPTTAGWNFTNTNTFSLGHPSINVYGENRKNWLVSPAIDLSALTAPVLTFDLAFTSYNSTSPISSHGGQYDDKFMVIISTDNGQTWSASDATVWSNVAGATRVLDNVSHLGEEISIPLTQYAGQTIKIAFYAESTIDNGDNDLHIANLSIGEMPACARPEMLEATNVTTTSITLSWREQGTANAWSVVYGTPGFDVETEAPITATDTFVVINNLVANTAYEFYVRANCGAESSEWSTPLTVNTDCDAITTLPFIETFEYQTTNEAPTCWSFPVVHNSNPSVSTTYAANGSKSLRFASSMINPTTAVTPQLNIELNTLRVKFNLKAENVNYSGTFEVGVMSDPNNANTFESVRTITPANTGWNQYEVAFNTTNLNGIGNYIAFRQHSNSNYDYYYWLDDVEITTIPDCDAPTNLTISNLTGSTVELNWLDDASQNSWEVYVCAADETPDFTQALAATNTNYYISGLNANTVYQAYVHTVCASGNGTSDWTSITFMTSSAISAQVPYLCDFSAGSENANWVLENGTQTNKWFIGQPTGMTDSVLFVSEDGITNAYNLTSESIVWAYRDIQFNNASEFELSFKWRCVGEGTTTKYDYLRVFLGDPMPVAAGTMTAPAGATQLGGDLNQQSSWQSASYTLNGEYANATKRLYFMWRNDYSTGSAPAAILDSIRVEAVDCGRPYNLTASNVTPYAADVTFTPASVNDNAWEYVMGVGTFNPDSAVVTPATNNTIHLAALTPETNYTVYVRTDCSGGDYSDWSNAVTFTTLVACPVPTQLNVSNVGLNTAEISWVENGSANAWNIEYGPTGFAHGTGTVVIANTNPFTLTGLASSTGYDVYVQADCGGGEVSAWSVDDHFETECGVFSLPFVEEFSNSMLPTCWNKYTGLYGVDTLASTYSGWYFTNNYVFGPGHARLNVFGTSCKYWLATPAIDLTGATEPTLTFKLALTQYNAASAATTVTPDDKFIVAVSTDNGATWQTARQWDGSDSSNTLSFANISAAGEIVNINLTPYAGQQIMIAFYGESTVSGGDNDLHIDSVVVADAAIVVTCDAPTNVDASNVTEQGATITWIAGGSETAWNLQYKAASANDWSNAIAVTGTPSHNLTGLNAATAYEVRVQADCGAGETSDWATATFTTLDETVETCPAPTGLAATDLQNEAIVLTWNQEANTANTWTVNYRTQGTTTWSTATANAVPFTLTGLTGLTTYEINVVANCTNGLVSDPSNTITATTTNVGINEYNANNISLYPNPTTGEFRIQNAELRIEKVEVYDVYGKLLNRVEVNDNQVTMSASNYAAGIYFVRIYTANGTATKTFVKK